MPPISNSLPPVLAGLDRFDVTVTPESGWDKFLDLLAEIFGADTRWFNGVLPEQEKQRIANQMRTLLADPNVGPAMLKEYAQLRRQTNSVDLENLLAARIGPHVHVSSSEDLREAVRAAVQGLETTFDPQAPAPTMSDGFDALTSELEASLKKPQIVAKAQGDGFERMLDLMDGFTRPHARDDVSDGVGLGILIVTMGFGAGAVNDMDRDVAPGVITGDELKSLQTRAAELPDSDRRILGVMLQQLLARNQVVIRHAPKGAADALAQSLSAKATDSETRAGTLMASLSGLELALPAADKHQFTVIDDAAQETMRGAIATQLRRELQPPTPPSVQRLAQNYLRIRLATVPSDTPPSAGLQALRALAT